MTEAEFEITLTTEELDPRVERVNAFMRDHNVEVNPTFMTKLDDPANDPSPLVAFATGTTGEVVGGIIGTTQFAWLTVSILAVSPEQRRTGVGSALIRFAESEARARGCRYSYLESMVYHAPEFFERHDYVQVGTLDDWDSAGHTKHIYRKVLNP